jgi:GMP synthase - Glutamine amidotransferase domain
VLKSKYIIIKVETMKKLSIHTFMHVPFEGLGCIEEWITKNGHTTTFTRFYEAYQLPNIDEIDWLIVMGGPMGIYDDQLYPWLNEEKSFISSAIEAGKTVIGICLGSQLIADVLRAKVYPNNQKEIGWFNLELTEDGRKETLLTGFEDNFHVFHWHGDTFDLPEGSKRLFQSEITANQAFLYKQKVLGLQFHFEVTLNSLQDMIKHGASELIESNTIQTAEKMLSQSGFIEENNKKMFGILDYLAK